MEDNQLGFIPHSTSSKQFAFKGIPPTRSLSEASEQSIWTWIITSCLTLGWALFVGLFFYEYLTTQFDEVWSVAINSLATTAFAILVYVWLMPELNKAFGQGPTIKKVDPNAIDLMRTGLTSLVLVGLSSAALHKNCK